MSKLRFLLVLLMIVVLLGLSSFWSRSSNIDNLAYVVGMGIDVGENNNLLVSFQISLPNSISGESGGQSDSSIINSIECTSIESGLNLLNSYVSKQVNLSHCKVIVFSEEIASKGLSPYLFTLIDDVQIRPDCNIIISRCDSAYFLENSKPVLEKLSSKYYEITPSSSEYTGYTENLTLNQFFYTLNTCIANPIAILGGVNTPNSQATPNSNNVGQDGSYKANETPIQSEPHIENIGLAVFKDDILVGELSGFETVCHLIISNKLNTCNISIPSPFVTGQNIDLRVTQKHKTKSKVDLVNGTPYICCDIALEARIVSMTGNDEFINTENIQRIEEYANSYMKYQILQYLGKTAREFGTDIDKFGKNLVATFLYKKDLDEFNWDYNYKNSFFHVEVNTNVVSGNLLMEN